MIQKVEEVKKRILQHDRKKKIAFIVLYGSQAKGTARVDSDIDLAVFYDGTSDERFAFRKKILSLLPEVFDVQLFQDLPLHVRKSIIKEGKLLYIRHFAETQEIYRQTYTAFDDFKKYLDEYCEKMMESVTHAKRKNFTKAE